MSNKILLGIVTFNPDLTRLIQNIDAIYEQVHKVVIIDNGSKNIDQVVDALKEKRDIVILRNGVNRGIAIALNQIGDYASQNNFFAFLTLDQDSIASKGLVEVLEPILLDKNVGVACPYINRKHCYSVENKTAEVKVAITSGNLVRTEAWEKTGGYWEYLFIDEVDHEFCYQLRLHGFKIIQSYQVSIDQIVGEPFTKTVLGYTFHPTNHSAFRRYYIARNNIIMQQLYPNEKEPFPHRYAMLFRIMISIMICEKNKRKKIHAIFRGIWDAFRWNLGNTCILKRREE